MTEEQLTLVDSVEPLTEEVAPDGASITDEDVEDLEATLTEILAMFQLGMVDLNERLTRVEAFIDALETRKKIVVPELRAIPKG